MTLNARVPLCRYPAYTLQMRGETRALPNRLAVRMPQLKVLQLIHTAQDSRTPSKLGQNGADTHHVSPCQLVVVWPEFWGEQSAFVQ